jgi:hypothetical protein
LGVCTVWIPAYISLLPAAAGKSVLVEAFNQVLGGAAPSECIRAPATSAFVEATFLVAPGPTLDLVHQLLQEQGLPARALPQRTAAAGAEGGASSAGGASILQPASLYIRREVGAAGAASALLSCAAWTPCPSCSSSWTLVTQPRACLLS